MILLTPRKCADYELLDSGNFEKLERFGKYILIRPEPQAVWDKHLPEHKWREIANVKFIAKTSNSGVWEKFSEMPDHWTVSFEINNKKINFKLALTAFKHVGIFPEQVVNWDFIYNSLNSFNVSNRKVLNLFAYTGGASLAASLAGAEVTHVDSIKQVVNWAKENSSISNLTNIKFIVDDAVKFVKREIRRGNKYNGIILDPPAFGHGPNGENWKLERDINALLKDVKLLLNEQEHFLILNTYSLSFSSLIVENIAKQIFTNSSNFETGEIYLSDKFEKKLPLGVFVKTVKR